MQKRVSFELPFVFVDASRKFYCLKVLGNACYLHLHTNFEFALKFVKPVLILCRSALGRLVFYVLLTEKCNELFIVIALCFIVVGN